MPRKVSATFNATLVKNTDKGGAWLAQWTITHEGLDNPIKMEFEAFSNASAGKRWFKEKVAANTPRKSVKMIATDAKDVKGKPVKFIGSLGFKAEV